MRLPPAPLDAAPKCALLAWECAAGRAGVPAHRVTDPNGVERGRWNRICYDGSETCADGSDLVRSDRRFVPSARRLVTRHGCTFAVARM
jgi:hypothetical protein